MTRSFPVWISVATIAFVSSLVPAWPQSEGGKQRVSLGIVVVPATQCDETRGACITGIRPGSAAERAGLVQGDVITRVAKTDLESPEALVDAMQAARVGERLDL